MSLLLGPRLGLSDHPLPPATAHLSQPCSCSLTSQNYVTLCYSSFQSLPAAFISPKDLAKSLSWTTRLSGLYPSLSLPLFSTPAPVIRPLDSSHPTWSILHLCFCLQPSSLWLPHFLLASAYFPSHHFLSLPQPIHMYPTTWLAWEHGILLVLCKSHLDEWTNKPMNEWETKGSEFILKINTKGDHLVSIM